jgi:hypothetical protein
VGAKTTLGTLQLLLDMTSALYIPYDAWSMPENTEWARLANRVVATDYFTSFSYINSRRLKRMSHILERKFSVYELNGANREQ